MPADKPKALQSKALTIRFPVYFALAFSLLMIILYGPAGIFDGVENYWQDTMYFISPDLIRSGDPRIMIAAIDDDTIKARGWPFTRDVHAALIDKLSKLGAKAIGFDVMFLDPDKRNPAGDKQLIKATRRSRRTIHEEVVDSRIQEINGKSTVNTKVKSPIEGLEEASQAIGYPNVDRVVDPDGHIRRMEIFSRYKSYPRDESVPFPSFDSVCAAGLTGKPLNYFADHFQKPWVFFLRFRKPTRWLRHPYAVEKAKEKYVNEDIVGGVYRPISVADILDGRLNQAQRDAIKGGLVLVGSTTLGLYDHYPAPFVKNQPGVEFHANTIDNILHDDFMRPISTWRILLIMLAFVWLTVAVARLPPAGSASVVAAVLAGWLGFTYWKFLDGVRYEVVAPSLGLVFSYLVLTVHRVLTEGAEKRFIKQTFGQFVAPEVVDDLVKDPGKVKLGGEKRDMSVLFLDIASFTSISEKMSPEELIRFLNHYLSGLSHLIHEQKGVIDKYIGDCIMAFWNAPIELKDHRARAAIAAFQCQQIGPQLFETLAPEIKKALGDKAPAFRVGVNSGEVTVGLTGSEKKIQYTVLGDGVNLASRLEGANKFFGSKIMISEDCYEGAKDVVEARELGRVEVKGKTIPIRIYEPLALKGQLKDGWAAALPVYRKAMEMYNTAVALFREKKPDESMKAFAAAKEVFAEALKLMPDDKTAKLYVTLCEDYSAILPPDLNWNGSIHLTEK